MPPLQRLRPAFATSHLPLIPIRLQTRPFASSTASLSHKPKPPATTTSAGLAIPPPPPSRWIAELKARIGKCVVFGCDDRQIARAADVLRVLAGEWRELLAGSEGFLTGGRRGIEGQVCLDGGCAGLGILGLTVVTTVVGGCVG